MFDAIVGTAVVQVDDGSRIDGAVSYEQDFYDDATIARLVAGLAQTMEAAACNSDLRLSELPIPPSPKGDPS